VLQRLSSVRRRAVVVDAVDAILRETSARLIREYDTERTRLVTDAQSADGRLSSTDWLVDADPLCAHMFALALHRVRSKVQPLIDSVLDVVKKHHTTSSQPRFATDEVFVLELRVANADEAAEGWPPTP
jgi:hypothetical protein